MLGKATLENGNRIELLQNGNELFPRLFADLEAAQHLITWQVLWFKPSTVAAAASAASLLRGPSLLSPVRRSPQTRSIPSPKSSFAAIDSRASH